MTSADNLSLLDLGALDLGGAEMIKYYDAYDERYKIAHDEGILWFLDEPTPEVEEWIRFNNIPIDDEICEIGCGEGRDALYLATIGYKMTAADVSKEAIAKCRDLVKEKDVIINWINYDALFISENNTYEKCITVYLTRS